MNISKMLRTFIGANIMIIMAFAFLPALLINPNVEFFQSALNYISKE